ncbi:MAG: YbaB/EbfC family nucleoid-associated protein [Calditrichaceae bacterium]|nr:YbaB/EbfC family nucleoid-associated protein [Calditrichaceae bacterium]
MVNMNSLLKQAQKMQEDMQKAQEGLVHIQVEGTAGGGMVKVTANGKMEVLSVHIEEEVVRAEDKEMLEDLIAAAVNQAMKAAQEKANEEMQKITGGMMGGLNLPGNFKIPGL